MNTPCIACGALTSNRRGERGAVRCDLCKQAWEVVRNRDPKRKAYSDPRYKAFPVEGRLCYLCGELIRTGTGSRDHVIPLSKGGTNDWANLRAVHRWCNSSKGARDA